MATITFAGHSAVLIEINSTVIAIDPWLKGNPSCPEDLENPEAIDFIVLTHGHSDHASDVLRLAKAYKSKVLATFELAQLLIKSGVPESQVIAMNKGGSYSENGISFVLTHAMHSNSFDSEFGTAYAGEACGVIVKSSESETIYHAGDTALFGDMQLIAQTYRPTVGLLPIGDRFTMGPEEAARAAKLMELRTVIPIHYNTFTQLTGTPEEFQKALKDDTVDVVILEPGESLRF